MDLVETARMARLLERYPARCHGRLFTVGEVDYCGASRSPVESFAARFAAKEALMKALGTGLRGGARWQDVEVVSDEAGAPHLRLHGFLAEFAERRGVLRAHLTLTHTRDLAGAYVVLEGGQE